MNMNYESPLTTACQATFETTGIAADGGVAGVLDLLAAVGIRAEVVFDGEVGGCPHCASQVLSEAA